MKRPVTIRPYEDRDRDGVKAVLTDLQRSEIALYSRMKAPEAIGDAYLDGEFKEVAEHQGCVLVAERDGRIAGYLTLFTHCDSADESDEEFYRYAYVGDLGVRAEDRNLGVGAALLAEAEQIARREGLPWLRLSVLAANADGRRFYQRAGFGEHLILLEKAL